MWCACDLERQNVELFQVFRLAINRPLWQYYPSSKKNTLILRVREYIHSTIYVQRQPAFHSIQLLVYSTNTRTHIYKRMRTARALSEIQDRIQVRFTEEEKFSSLRRIVPVRRLDVDSNLNIFYNTFYETNYVMHIASTRY